MTTRVRPADVGMPPRTEVLRERAHLEALVPGWDALARATGRPYGAPGWMLAWFDHVAAPQARLEVVTVHRGEDDELVGVFPLVRERARSGIVTGRALAHDTSSYCEPLARRGHERAVAVAIARSLDDIDVLSLSGLPVSSPWPGLLRDAWTGPRPRLDLVRRVEAPYVDLPVEGFDAWFSAKSRNFRQQARRRRRELLARGGTFTRATTPDALRAGLRDLGRLHLARWSERGGSQAWVPGVAAMLDAAVDRLDPDRLQLWTVEVAGNCVAAALFLAAGDEMHYWLGGFDEAYAPLSVSLLLLVEAVRHASEGGWRRVSFGPGEQPYKYRLASGAEDLVWLDLVPVGRRFPWVRLVQTPRRLYRLAARTTPPRAKDVLRRVRGRAAGPDRRHVQEEGQDGRRVEGASAVGAPRDR